MKMRKKIKGIAPMIYSFFNKENKIDTKLIIEQVNMVNSMGVHGIACLGLGTEVNKLSFKEKVNIIKIVSEFKKKNMYLAITISGEKYSDQLKLIKVANAHHADWLILQPPSGKKLTEVECYNFFEKIINKVNDKIFVGIQNAPEYLKSSLSTKSVLKLYKQFENFRIIKGEGSVKVLKKIITEYPSDLKVFNGRCGLEIIDSLKAGCEGIMPSVEFSDQLLDIYKLYKSKNNKLAYKKYNEIKPFIKFVIKDIPTFICYGKRIYSHRLGLKKIYDRKPNLSPSKYGIKKSKFISKKLGYY
jgi:4-hydroxy-tetrahydrodipicolinate synthase